MKDVNVNGQRDVNDELVGFLSIFGNIFQKDGNPAAAMKLGEKKNIEINNTKREGRRRRRRRR